MSKEEFLKIQTCVLKVNIHCDGCKHKVKKILHKIDGVYKTNIDSELGKVTVSGNVDPETLIKKLAKSGKHAEIWGASKANNNNQQNQLNNQFKNLQIDSGKGGNNKGQGGGGGQKGGGGGNNQQQPKGGGGPIVGQGMNPMQLQELKALQDKMPQLKGLKMPLPMPFGNNNKDQNQKAVKFMPPPEYEDLTDDEFDDEDYDDEFDDDEIDEMDDGPPLNNKMKPVMGNPQGVMPNMMMNNIMNGQNPQLMKGGNNGANGKKGGPTGGGGGGGNMPVQMNLGGGGNNNGGGKKGGNGNNNQNQGGGGGGGGGGAGQKGGKNGGGMQNGGGQNKNANNGQGGGGGGGGGGGNPNFNANGAKKGVGMNDGLHGMPNMMAMNAGGGGNVGPSTASMPMGQMGQMGNVPMGQMPNIAAVQGLPAAAINGANAGGYFQGAGPEMMAGNPYYQQQMAAMMMNQQRANGNERFQPMMYARPPPAVNYWPPHPYSSYPYHAPPPGEHYTDAFNDENTSSCSLM